MLSVRYRNPERNWLVANMRSNKRESFIATGDIPYSETEEPVQLYGEWIEDPKYGKQFKVSTAHRVLPTSVSGLRNYLAASEDIPGIGPGRADKLVKHFGSKLLSVLDSDVTLSTCPGISGELARRIVAGWRKDSQVRNLSVYLASHNVSPRWASRILRQWDAGSAIDRITANPYSLTAIDGIGFITADEIAKSMGWPANSQQRAEAACLHILSEGMQNGNSFLHEGEILEGVVKLIAPRVREPKARAEAQKAAAAALSSAIAKKDVTVDEVSDGTMTLRLIYLPWLYKAEKSLAEKIADLAAAPCKTPVGLNTAIAEVEKRSNVTFSPKQLEAIRGVFSNNILVITGGPGTGKTTCTKAICDIASSLGIRTIRCAPTGRAAKRLSEVTELPASTIHRLLEYRSGQPVRGENNPLDNGLFIIDESSMLELDLANKLFAAIPRGSRIVVIGDADQLPAIGAGNTLRDILASRRIQSVILDTIFRQAESSLIIRNAHLIHKGELPRFPEAKGSKDDSYVMWIPTGSKDAEGGRDNPEWVCERLSSLVRTHIPDHLHRANTKIDPIKDIQVLVPMKKHSLGIYELNKVLQSALNPNGQEIIAGGKVFRIGDRVMQTRNNYAEGMDIYNGDIGFITAHRPEDKDLDVEFYGRNVSYPYTELGDLQLAYAQTIHKSQGSEYPVVVVIMGYQHWPMLERNLLYTANTRAKKLCLYIAAKGAIKRAVENNPVHSRNSFLAQRIRIATDKAQS